MWRSDLNFPVYIAEEVHMYQSKNYIHINRTIAYISEEELHTGKGKTYVHVNLVIYANKDLEKYVMRDHIHLYKLIHSEYKYLVSI